MRVATPDLWRFLLLSAMAFLFGCLIVIYVARGHSRAMRWGGVSACLFILAGASDVVRAWNMALVYPRYPFLLLATIVGLRAVWVALHSDRR